MQNSVFTDNIREKSVPVPDNPNPAPLSDVNISFLETLKSDHPNFIFKPGKKFLFRPKKSIFYVENNENFRLLLLHELSHALLNHFTYETSIERLKIERDAWEKTRQLCEQYSIRFSEELASEELDTYRNWVHQKTLCKNCGLTCLEVDSNHLFCPFCQKTFKK